MLLVVLPLEPLSLHPMFKSRIINSIRKAGNLKTIVLGLLVTCLLLSTCAVRKSIEAFFQDSARTESTIGNGFKKIRVTTDKIKFTNPQLCSPTENTTLQNIHLPASKAPGVLLPQALMLTTLLSFISAVLFALWHCTPASFFSKASFAFNSTPIYIKNRLLLI